MNAIKHLGLVINNKNPGAIELGDNIKSLAESLGVTVKKTLHYPVPKTFLKGMDACCTIGGDGTILGIAEQAIQFNVPVFGIQHGKLGFLATFNPEDAKEKILSLLKGEYQRVERTVIQCHTVTNLKKASLNDVVIKNHETSKLIHLRVYASNQLINEYSCDGLIFSTPTGSTAYNLSAGGPIVDPLSQVITMTPICAHTLTNRSVIFNSESELRIECVEKENLTQVAIDGQIFYRGDTVFPLTIKNYSKTFSLLQLKNHSHFNILQSKLKWGDF